MALPANRAETAALQQLQRDVNERMRDANRLADEMRRENPGMAGTKTPEDWWRSFSAPGTEAFKQDFARWESLQAEPARRPRER